MRTGGWIIRVKSPHRAKSAVRPWVLALLVCSALPGCSVLESIPEPASDAPRLSVISPDLKKVATEVKFTGPIEVAGPIAAKPATVAPWIVCLRTAVDDSTRPTYALFYNGPKLISYRFAAIVDRCDEQTFKPL